MLKTTHERLLIEQEQRIIRSMLDEINSARVCLMQVREWHRRLAIPQAGHYCDVSVRADAVAQSMSAFMKANSK